MKKSTLYRLLMAAAMLVVVLNTLLAVRALHALFKAQSWKAHTLEVLMHTRAMEMEVASGNAAVRGYLLTGQTVFADRFGAAKARIDAEVGEIALLTADSGSQKDRIAYLRKRITVKRAALETALSMRQGAAGPLDEGVLRPVLADSPDGGPSVSYCVRQIENEEFRLLAVRTAEVNHLQGEVWWSFAGVTLLDLVLLAVAAELLIRALRNRERIAESSARIDVLNYELRIANQDLEARVALRTRELEVSNQELEAFSYSVSHDLRAPLRTIDGFSLALQEDFADKLNDEGRDYISRVRAGVQRMGSLIDALLQLSRVTRSDITTESVDLSQLATLVFNELKAQEPGRDVTFTAVPDISVQADPRLLRVTLENLIGNALKFSSKTPDARVEFGVRAGTGELDGKRVYFIRDNGAGFDMKYVDRLFTAFQRLHGDRDFKGSGIGLATVSRIIRRHHGTIGAESEPGQGATFYFTLGG